MSNLEQVSVPLPPELREFVRLVAAREERSQASPCVLWCDRANHSKFAACYQVAVRQER
jgi:hypothetical protein